MNNLLPKILLTIISFLFIEATCFAEIYKWTDSNGVVHFGEQAPREGKSEKIIINSAQNNISSNEVVTISSNEAVIKQKKIVMYSTKWCGYCKKARSYFNKKGIKFTDYDVESRPSKKREFKSLGGTGYPLILIGKDKKMHGFSISGFERRYNT